MGDLKDYRYKDLKYFLVANALFTYICLFLVGGFYQEFKIDSFASILSIATIFPVLTFIMDMVIPEKYKYKLYKKTYHGACVWNDIDSGFHDHRVDDKNLQEYVNKNNYDKNNQQWYRIFR